MHPSRIISVLCLLISIAVASPQHTAAQNRATNKMNRQEWFKEMRVYKHDFITKELDLSQEQQKAFFPIYDEMNDRILKLQRDSHAFERKVTRSKTPVSDVEYEKATEAAIELRAKEAQISKEYYAKFKGILTPAQIYKLTQSERKFTREVMKQHSKMKQQNPRN